MKKSRKSSAKNARKVSANLQNSREKNAQKINYDSRKDYKKFNQNFDENSENSLKNFGVFANKNLGQNFLFDREILREIVNSAEISRGENVLEIGAGLGTLTAEILSRGAKVFAVEFDENLAKNLCENVVKILKKNDEISRENYKNSLFDFEKNDENFVKNIKNSEKISRENCEKKSSKILKELQNDENFLRENLEKSNENSAEILRENSKKIDEKIDEKIREIVEKNLVIFNEDFLKFDLKKLSACGYASRTKNYKIVANIPYNLTAKIVEKICFLPKENRAKIAVLLVQKEVAERLSARVGNLSVFAISAQLFAQVSRGIFVRRDRFLPAPKVDSEVVILNFCAASFYDSHSEFSDEKFVQKFWKIVGAGFSEKRKKIKTALSRNLQISKIDAENLLKKCEISPEIRAQNLTLENWFDLARKFEK